MYTLNSYGQSRMRNVLFSLTSLILIAFPAHGQDKNWSAKAELGGSFFFGNTSQIALTTSLSGNVKKSKIEVDGRAGYVYGQAANAEGVRTMNKKTWDGSGNLNLNTGGKFNGFLRGKIESIFEKKIDLRYNAGLGGRYQFSNSDAGRIEASIAILAEKTVVAGVIKKGELGPVWSARFKLSRNLSGSRVKFESDSTWEPTALGLSVFTLTSRNSIAFQVNQQIAVSLSFVDLYDTRAMGRGAKGNNDGQIFFSLVSTF